MKYIVVDENLKNIEKLNIFNYKIVKTKKNSKIPEPLNTHPDLLVHKIGNKIVVDSENLEYYQEAFEGYEVIPTEMPLGSLYSDYVKLNGFQFKNYFVHNLKYTDTNVLKFYKENNFELIDVKQGYSKCNTLITSKFLLTSDMSIYNALNKKVNIYKIHHKDILLKNYNYGFIGGASGYINKHLILTGSLKNHSSYNYIKEIINLYNIKVLKLSEDEIEDFGSIILI